MKQDLDQLWTKQDEAQQECTKQKALIDMCWAKFVPNPATPAHAMTASCGEAAGIGQPQAEGGQDVTPVSMQEADLVEATNTGAPPAQQLPIPPPQEEQEMEVDTEEVMEAEDWLLDREEEEEATDQDVDASGVSSHEVPPEEAETPPNAGGETPYAGMTAGMSGLSVTLPQACEVKEPSEGTVETVTPPAEDSTTSQKVE